jgi:hypothetical protein
MQVKGKSRPNRREKNEDNGSARRHARGGEANDVEGGLFRYA